MDYLDPNNAVIGCVIYHSHNARDAKILVTENITDGHIHVKKIVGKDTHTSYNLSKKSIETSNYQVVKTKGDITELALGGDLSQEQVTWLIDNL